MLIEVVSMAGGRGEGFSFGIVLEPDCQRELELELELELGLEFVVQSALGAGATCCSRRAVGRNRAWAAYTHIQRPQGDGKVSRRWCLHWQERGRRCGGILDRIS